MHPFDVFQTLRAKRTLVLTSPCLKAENHHVVCGGRLFPSRKPTIGLRQVFLNLIVFGR